VETPAHGLRVLALVLERLERESFSSVLLARLRSEFDVTGVSASKRIAKLERLMDWLDSSEHVLLRVVGLVVLWREQLSMAVEKWRADNGGAIVRWTRAVAEIEALSSFGALAFEHPHWVFPQIAQTPEPFVRAIQLSHPLISAERSVANNIELGNPVRLLIVSGSNMSGKSTLLRALGLNTVLAWAGAPVSALRMELGILRTAASIRVIDSLQENRSRFYAEILRIRHIVELARTGEPVLFLMDELLSGTNSHDRRIGAAAILRSLVTLGAIGAVTTHDLALTGIEEELRDLATNVHFDDQISEGKISFDYRLRPGVVTHSNALELMRAVGLELSTGA
jgi:DNA mismatch repair ATPase MutS